MDRERAWCRALDDSGSRIPPSGSPISGRALTELPPLPQSKSPSNLLFAGPLAWTEDAACLGHTAMFFAPAGERPEARQSREVKAAEICDGCAVLAPCRLWARQHREYGFWGGESEEARAAAGYRVDMPVGRIARYPRGAGVPVRPRMAGVG